MRLRFSPHFRRYWKAPPEIQRAFDKEVRLLLQNLGHPSRRAKKYDASQTIGQVGYTEPLPPPAEVASGQVVTLTVSGL